MTLTEFTALVRTMRRDQIAFVQHRTSAALTKARYSEKLVDQVLGEMPQSDHKEWCPGDWYATTPGSPFATLEPREDTPTIIEGNP